jgi:hypothetical protein
MPDLGRSQVVTMILIGFYLLACGAASVYLIVDVWYGRFWFYETFLPIDALSAEQEAVVRPLTYTVAGGVVGAVIRSFQGIHYYGAVRRDFQISYSASYLVGPWTAALIALAAYALVRGGLLVFGGVEGTEATPGASAYAYFALGILTGFAWEKVLIKLNAVAGQIFAVEPDVRAGSTSDHEQGGESIPRPKPPAPRGDEPEQ